MVAGYRKGITLLISIQVLVGYPLIGIDTPAEEEENFRMKTTGIFCFTGLFGLYIRFADNHFFGSHGRIGESGNLLCHPEVDRKQFFHLLSMSGLMNL